MTIYNLWLWSIPVLKSLCVWFCYLVFCLFVFGGGFLLILVQDALSLCMISDLTESSHFLEVFLWKCLGSGLSWCHSQLGLTKYCKVKYHCLKHLFLTVLKPGNPRSRCWQIQCLVRVPFLVHRGLSSHCVLTWWKGWSCSLGSPL